MNLYVKEKCKWCAGAGWEYVPGYHENVENQSCSKCDGEGCIKIGVITFVFLFIARQLKLLLDRYGE
jgi:DnaJ-class molecular chaperone